MLKCAPIPSEERVVGLNPRHGMDKLAKYYLSVLNMLISMDDLGVLIGQCACGDYQYIVQPRSMAWAIKWHRGCIFGLGMP